MTEVTPSTACGVHSGAESDVAVVVLRRGWIRGALAAFASWSPLWPSGGSFVTACWGSQTGERSAFISVRLTVVCGTEPLSLASKPSAPSQQFPSVQMHPESNANTSRPWLPPFPED